LPVSNWLTDGDDAVALARKSVGMSPNGADVTAVLAFILTYCGKPLDAITFIQRAMRLSPAIRTGTAGRSVAPTTSPAISNGPSHR
jgi:hypothetical protein